MVATRQRSCEDIHTATDGLHNAAGDSESCVRALGS